MSTISFDDLVNDPTTPSVDAEPPMDMAGWEIEFIDIYEDKKSGYSFIDIQNKKITNYVVQGFKVKENTLNTSKLAEFIKETKIPIIKTSIGSLYKFEFDPEEQVTCKYFAASNKASKRTIEPIDFPFEWPNETPINICTKVSTKSVPAGCGCVNAQFECKIGFKEDVRNFYSYQDKENKIFIRVGLQRYGFGSELSFVHVGYTNGSNNAFSYFGPVEKELDVIRNNPSNPDLFNSMTYFGDDYKSVFDKYLSSLLDDVFAVYGELIKEINPAKEIEKEYFDYVKSV